MSEKHPLPPEALDGDCCPFEFDGQETTAVLSLPLLGLSKFAGIAFEGVPNLCRHLILHSHRVFLIHLTTGYYIITATPYRPNKKLLPDGNPWVLYYLVHQYIQLMEETVLITQTPQTGPQTAGQAELAVETVQPEIPSTEENVLQNSPFSDYFTHLDSHNMLNAVNHKYSKALQQRLQEQIEEGTVQVSRKRKQFHLFQKQPPTQEQKLYREKLELEEKKNEAVSTLKELQRQERELLLQNSRLMRSRERRSMTLLEENKDDGWLEEIRSAIKEHRRFKRSIEQKNKEVLEKAQYLKQEAISHRHSFLNKMQEDHNKEALNKRELYLRLKEQETENQRKCQELVLRVRPSKYQHERVNEEQHDRLMRAESERTLKLEDFRRRRQIQDWPSIHQHEQRYYDFLEDRKEVWMDQFNDMKQQHRSRLKQYRGLYSERAKQESLAMKEEAIKEGEKGLKMLGKIRDYDDYVSEHFKPKIMKKTLINPQSSPTIRRKQLGRHELRMKGLQYLAKVKETVQSFKVLPQSKQVKENEGKTTSLPKIQSQTVYKNYLNDQPVKRRQRSDVDQFQTALTERRGAWAESALSLISKMESNDHSKGERPMISSALNKIELLKALY